MTRPKPFRAGTVAAVLGATPLASEALNLRVFAVMAARDCGAATIADLATVTEAQLVAAGARQRDVNALRSLLVATGGRFAGVRPAGRQRGTSTRVEAVLTREQLARLDEVRGERSRSRCIAELFGGHS